MRTLRYIILLLCWPIFATESLGQTPDSVYVDRHSLWRHTLGESLQNPAMMNHAYLKPFTELSILLDYRKQSEAFSLEQGTGFMMPEISARSYIRLTPSSVVWGEAAYSNGSHQISHLIMLHGFLQMFFLRLKKQSLNVFASWINRSIYHLLI